MYALYTIGTIYRFHVIGYVFEMVFINGILFKSCMNFLEHLMKNEMDCPNWRHLAQYVAIFMNLVIHEMFS